MLLCWLFYLCKNILIIESRDPIDTEISKTNPDSTMDTKLEESKISKKCKTSHW